MKFVVIPDRIRGTQRQPPSAVPAELEQQLGDGSYYEVALTQTDCTRIRELAELAMATRAPRPPLPVSVRNGSSNC